MLVAELLLRKTTRKQAVLTFTKLIEAYSSAAELSRATTFELGKIVQSSGLGHLKSLTLSRMANYLIKNHNGKVPESEKELLGIPGIGQYTANAVRCFAYGYDEPLVDTNIVRIVQRCFGVVSRRKRARDDKELWAFVSTMIPRGKSRELNYALLDLGGNVCLSKNPKCEICPVNDVCQYHLSSARN